MREAAATVSWKAGEAREQDRGEDDGGDKSNERCLSLVHICDISGRLYISLPADSRLVLVILIHPIGQLIDQLIGIKIILQVLKIIII